VITVIKIFKGNILYSETPEKLTVLENGYIVVLLGRVKGVYQVLPEEYEGIEPEAETDGLIIPGFCDLHIHAPQWINRGLGYSMELLPWLMKYTFPAEERFGDASFARDAYGMFVEELKRSETTRACVFATVHRDSTMLLAELLRESGLGAYVGKVNMDRNSIPSLMEQTDESLMETREIIGWMNETDGDNPLVRYILTPRYVPCTTPELMRGLAALAEEFGLPVQSHLDENRSEIQLVRELHPESRDFTSVYNDHGLLPAGRTVMAHCIHNTDEEIEMAKEQDVMVAHCPQSNANLSSGIMPLRKYLDRGIRAGLGSDVAAGHSMNMRDHIVAAIEMSKLCWTLHPELRALSFSEAFHLATKGGGSFFGKVGSFEEGYEFDALIIEDGSVPPGTNPGLEERLERYIYTGSNSQIAHKYVFGERVF
jgi:guanine deaminase